MNNTSLARGTGKSALLSKLAEHFGDKTCLLAIKADQLPAAVDTVVDLSKEILKTDDLLPHRIVDTAEKAPWQP